MDYRFFFFAGAEYREGETNAFTAHFIRNLAEIPGIKFSLIKGIHHRRPLTNAIWALNQAQKPLKHPEQDRIITSSVNQIITLPYGDNTQLSLLSSSYGSVVAAQTACCLAERHPFKKLMSQPFNVVLGTSLLSKESDLYRKLLFYQNEGVIGTIIYDELQDEGDNSTGLGGTTRFEAYRNALGICFPFMTGKFKGPSFLNTDSVTGHLHRVRAQSVEKAIDFLHVILVDYRLGGNEGKVKAKNF